MVDQAIKDMPALLIRDHSKKWAGEVDLRPEEVLFLAV